MDTKLGFKRAVLGFCVLLSFTEASCSSTTSKQAVADFGQENLEYYRTCYVEKSKVGELIIRMNNTVQILNRKDRFLTCWDQVKLAEVDPGSIDFCTEDRISQIQQELTDVVERLLELAIRLEEPSKREVLRLDKQKFDLIDKLAALRVFYGPSPCDSCSIVIYPFGPLIDALETSLDQKLALFQTARPLRPTRNFTLPARKPGIDEMLNSENSFQQLLEMARLNPAAMSKAVPRIVALRYSERISTFEKLVDFTEGLPTIENRIYGFSAIYDEMFRYNRKPDSPKLMKLVVSVQRLEEFAATSPSSVGESAKFKFADLVKDPELSQLIFLLSQSFLELTETASSNPTSMSTGLPEIISRSYNASDSQVEALLTFVEGLPTTENKIIGFVAVHDEIHRHGRTLNLAHLLKLAKKVKILNGDEQTTSTLANTATALKWTNLIRDLSPLMLIGEKAECHFTNVAYGTQLTVADFGYPESAYVYQDQSQKRTWSIYPAIQNDKLVFRILQSGDYPFFASDTNANTDSRNTKYQTKTSERYVLCDDPSRLPTNAEINWKIVLVPAKANQFRILSAKSDDFMFAHKSATAWNNLRRRVLLGRQSFTDHDHIPNADQWTLNCRPGTFSIPSI